MLLPILLKPVILFDLLVLTTCTNRLTLNVVELTPKVMLVASNTAKHKQTKAHQQSDKSKGMLLPVLLKPVILFDLLVLTTCTNRLTLNVVELTRKVMLVASNTAKHKQTKAHQQSDKSKGMLLPVLLKPVILFDLLVLTTCTNRLTLNVVELTRKVMLVASNTAKHKQTKAHQQSDKSKGMLLPVLLKPVILFDLLVLTTCTNRLTLNVVELTRKVMLVASNTAKHKQTKAHQQSDKSKGMLLPVLLKPVILFDLLVLTTCTNRLTLNVVELTRKVMLVASNTAKHKQTKAHQQSDKSKGMLLPVLLKPVILFDLLVLTTCTNRLTLNVVELTRKVMLVASNTAKHKQTKAHQQSDKSKGMLLPVLLKPVILFDLLVLTTCTNRLTLNVVELTRKVMLVASNTAKHKQTKAHQQSDKSKGMLLPVLLKPVILFDLLVLTTCTNRLTLNVVELTRKVMLVASNTAKHKQTKAHQQSDKSKGMLLPVLLKPVILFDLLVLTTCTNRLTLNVVVLTRKVMLVASNTAKHKQTKAHQQSDKSKGML